MAEGKCLRISDEGTFKSSLKLGFARLNQRGKKLSCDDVFFTMVPKKVFLIGCKRATKGIKVNTAAFLREKTWKKVDYKTRVSKKLENWNF